jgi:hypothetical protein
LRLLPDRGKLDASTEVIRTMQPAVVIGSVALFGGLLSLGAGTAGWRALRRIRDTGVAVWAQICPAPRAADDSPSGYRPLLRYTTSDGLDLEVFSPAAPTRSRPLVEGRPVLLHYDPADPTQVVLPGMRPYGDLLFITIGAVASVGSIALMALVG